MKCVLTHRTQIIQHNKANNLVNKTCQRTLLLDNATEITEKKHFFVRRFSLMFIEAWHVALSFKLTLISFIHCNVEHCLSCPSKVSSIHAVASCISLWHGCYLCHHTRWPLCVWDSFSEVGVFYAFPAGVHHFLVIIPHVVFKTVWMDDECRSSQELWDSSRCLHIPVEPSGYKVRSIFIPYCEKQKPSNESFYTFQIRSKF